MITHAIDSYWISSQNKAKPFTFFLKNAKNYNSRILQQTLQTTHRLKLLDKMYEYKMDPTSLFEDKEQTRFRPGTDGQTGGQTDSVKPVYPHPSVLSKRGYKHIDMSGKSFVILNRMVSHKKSHHGLRSMADSSHVAIGVLLNHQRDDVQWCTLVVLTNICNISYDVYRH